ncbi:hypothetical protein EGC86_12595 [Shewanella frigidimarina]|nr:hypothetical protein EGC86_12595 [Shewanella frigidimarina]
MYVYSAEALSLWMTDPFNGQLLMLIVYWNCLIYQQPNLQNPFFATYNKPAIAILMIIIIIRDIVNKEPNLL